MARWFRSRSSTVRASSSTASHPAYLEGYGAYGIELNPAFSATRIAWLERGGVFAVCHVRGGGWYGEAWHQAGMIATKPHTWQDFIACGRWLIAHKYTSSAHLAGEGTSAGGITIGRAITTQPHLFAAALDVVGASNALRAGILAQRSAEHSRVRHANERGRIQGALRDGCLRARRSGHAYPAVMLITGYNDPRVSSWELAKFTARLQTSTTSGRPILLRVDYDAGHGFLAASRDAERSSSSPMSTRSCSGSAAIRRSRGIPTRIFPRPDNRTTSRSM